MTPAPGSATSTTTVDAAIAKIEAAAIELPVEAGGDGHRWVRASAVLKAAGIKSASLSSWERSGTHRVRHRTIRVKVSPTSPRGLVKLWRLDDVRARLEHRAGGAAWRPWTPKESQRLTDLYGRPGVTFDTIAREVGRTPQACRRQAGRLGIDRASEAGLLRQTQIGRLLGCKRARVRWWVERGGLRATRLVAPGGWANAVRPADLVKFLKEKRSPLWDGLSRPRREMLEAMAFNDRRADPSRRAA